MFLRSQIGINQLFIDVIVPHSYTKLITLEIFNQPL